MSHKVSFLFEEKDEKGEVHREINITTTTVDGVELFDTFALFCSTLGLDMDEILEKIQEEEDEISSGLH